MKKIAAGLILVFYFIPRAGAQQQLPDYKTVVEKFFYNYRDDTEDGEMIQFAKKENGWFVNIISYPGEELIRTNLFWSAEKNSFLPLGNYSQAVSADYASLRIGELLSNQDAYDYERCMYYGYENWDEDLIRDFGDKELKNDTLIEGLARAYSFYAGRYTWHQFGQKAMVTDSLQVKTGDLEYPSDEQMAKYKEFSDKAIAQYQLLAKRNPCYQTKTGTAAIRLFIEKMSRYDNTLYAGRTAEAKKYLQSIKADSNTKKAGRNFLNSCAKNGILITFGDTDTYPLEYLQDAENFRTDVTVLNYPMLGFVPYLRYIKTNKNISFSTNNKLLAGEDFQYFIKKENSTQACKLEDLIRSVQQREPRGTDYSQSFIQFSCSGVIAGIDSIAWKKLFNLTTHDTSINWELPDFMDLSTFIIFDIINDNLNKRPVFLTAELETLKGLDQLRPEGIVYRVVPLLASNTFLSKTDADYQNCIGFFNKYYKPVLYKKDDPYCYPPFFDILHMELYDRIIQYHVGKNNNTQGRLWSLRYINSYKGIANIPLVYNSPKIAVSIMRSGLDKEGIQLLEHMGEYLENRALHYSASDIWVSKEIALGVLDEYLSTLTNRKLDSKKLRAIISELENE